MAQKAAVRGTAELRRKLRKMKSSLTNKVVSRAAAKALEPVKEAAERRAPRSGGTPTRGGKHLKDNIIIEGITDNRAFLGGAALGPHEDAFHGIFFTREFGAPHVAPQPWLRPAWDINRARMVDRLGEEIMRILRVSAALTR